MVLCLRIARSVLDLYSTQWLEQDWGLGNIRVYGRKTENSSVLELRYPYLRLDLHRPSSSVPQGVFMPSQDSEASSDMSMDELLHRCPYALGLGVVLMQILLGDRLQNCTAIWNGSNELSLSDDIKVNVNDRMVQAMKLQQECQARFPCDWALLKAIAKCTDIGLFEAAESDHPRLFRDNVLLPLERAILQDHACGHTSDGLDQKKFLEPLQYISQSLFKINNRLKLHGFEPDDVWDGLVRVAILDTGCDFALKEIKEKIIGNIDGNLPRGVRAPGIVGWKDFVDLSRGEEKAMVDESENRHGTVMTHLLFQTMGLAKVYIGRVAKADREEGVSERVVEAIEWAADKWKADIISISLSLENPTEQIRERIDAVGKRALILASAGNNRPPKRQPIAFPASSPSVICVHSHNGHGKPSEFTPLARNHSPNFQVIGQDINISGPGNAVQTVEGTSCSTAIAAGIAAYVLDFARACGIAWKRKKAQQQRSQAPRVVDELAKKKDLLLERCETLKNQQVMQRVFYEYMTDLGQRQLGKYNPVNPEMLFDLRDDDWQTSALFNIARVLEAYRDDKQMDPPYLS
ncbi:subtilisin-like protein [Coniochaeta sp. PMI_546]|nr:subtilisin-like protein [Coniochaeta sp. PMI_546]